VADQNYIDNVAETIAIQVQSLQQEMVRDLLKLSKDKRFKSIDEFLLAIDQLDLEQVVRFKAQNILSGYNAAHTQILSDMTLFADVTEDTLRALTNFSTSSFTDSLGSMAGVFKRELIKGALGGVSEQGIFQAIQQQAGLSNRQMRTLVTTGLTDYSRSVGKIMMDNSPPTTRFRYIGAIDDKTRDLCLELWAAGEMTKQQIIDFKGADVLIRGGGFNCRHEWVEIAIEDKSKDFRSADA
tara:strand:- start:2263 stop:2982 length:720 start_codon:yes stop_codon:yes gene_type:complete